MPVKAELAEFKLFKTGLFKGWVSMVLHALLLIAALPAAVEELMKALLKGGFVMLPIALRRALPELVKAGCRLSLNAQLDMAVCRLLNAFNRAAILGSLLLPTGMLLMIEGLTGILPKSVLAVL